MFLGNLATITPWSAESIGAKITGMGGAALSGTAGAVYPAADLAIYVPFSLSRSVTVAQLFWVNGGTASGNVDAGIYSADGTRLTSTGSTAQAGTNAPQSVNITDIQIGAGLFFIAIAMNNGTGTLFRATFAQLGLAITTGMYQQATAFPLPANATFANPTFDYIPAFGFTPGSVL